jgi:hypothetical protein
MTPKQLTICFGRQQGFSISVFVLFRVCFDDLSVQWECEYVGLEGNDVDQDLYGPH